MSNRSENTSQDRIEGQIDLILRDATNEESSIHPDVEARIVSILMGADSRAPAELVESSGLTQDLLRSEGNSKSEVNDDSFTEALATVLKGAIKNPQAILRVLLNLRHIPRSVNAL